MTYREWRQIDWAGIEGGARDLQRLELQRLERRRKTVLAAAACVISGVMVWVALPPAPPAAPLVVTSISDNKGNDWAPDASMGISLARGGATATEMRDNRTAMGKIYIGNGVDEPRVYTAWTEVTPGPATLNWRVFRDVEGPPLAAGAVSLPTSTIIKCGPEVSVVAAGVVPTDAIDANFSTADIPSGYEDNLVIYKYASRDAVNFKVCNLRFNDRYAPSCVTAGADGSLNGAAGACTAR